jgi:hypothetical protein
MTEQALEPMPQREPAAATPEAASRDAAVSNGAVPRVALGAPNGAPSNGDREAGPDGSGACTQAQLRRFIKSRPYVPLHELRRRFGLNGSDDDVGRVDVDGRHLFVGLPEREAALLGELLRHGEVGYELLLDPTSPIIVGLFPMRPVQRP